MTAQVTTPRSMNHKAIPFRMHLFNLLCKSLQDGIQNFTTPKIYTLIPSLIHSVNYLLGKQIRFTTVLKIIAFIFYMLTYQLFSGLFQYLTSKKQCWWLLNIILSIHLPTFKILVTFTFKLFLTSLS